MNEEILDIITDSIAKQNKKVLDLDKKYQAVLDDTTLTKKEIESRLESLNKELEKTLQDAIKSVPMPKDGKDGANGLDGKDGKTVVGKDGKDGRDGRDYNEAVAAIAVKDLVDKYIAKNQGTIEAVVDGYVESTRVDLKAMEDTITKQMMSRVDENKFTPEDITASVTKFFTANHNLLKGQIGKTGPKGTDGKDGTSISSVKVQKMIDDKISKIKADKKHKKPSIKEIKVEGKILIIIDGEGNKQFIELPQYESNGENNYPAPAPVSSRITKLEFLVDVELSGVAEGDALVYSNGKWTNGPGVDIYGKADLVGIVDIEITDFTKGVILRDSTDARWRITVDTDGLLITTKL